MIQKTRIMLFICCTLITLQGTTALGQDKGIAAVPIVYRKLVAAALDRAGVNKLELEKILKESPADMKEGTAFLIAYMPETDLVSLNSSVLLSNIRKAYQARSRFSWAKKIPDSIFLNEVLPYRVFTEANDNWRANFYDRFSKYVSNCKTIKEAILEINKHIRDELKVDYNTKRKRADQNPTESISLGMASCTGLSILLVDALRAVGIPARIAGTPNWHDNRGNHSWCEVWIDGEWNFTEYYPAKALNQSWFLADAGKADPGSREHSIYAVSFKPATTTFPTWGGNNVHAHNVTQRYIDQFDGQQKQKLSDKNYTQLKVTMYTDPDHCQHEDRIKCSVDIFQAKDQIGGGSTATKLQDANDQLTFLVEKNKSYTLKYSNANGAAEKHIVVADQPLDVRLYNK